MAMWMALAITRGKMEGNWCSFSMKKRGTDREDSGNLRKAIREGANGVSSRATHHASIQSAHLTLRHKTKYFKHHAYLYSLSVTSMPSFIFSATEPIRHPAYGRHFLVWPAGLTGELGRKPIRSTMVPPAALSFYSVLG